jgi:sugar phosphate isomerase/epimerase
MPSRRTFLTTAAAGAALTSLTPGALVRAAAELVMRQGQPPFRISLAQWSLHRAHFSGALPALGFPAKAQQLGFEAVEYVNAFFLDKVKDEGWLGELKRRCDHAGVRSLLIMCDGLGALGDADTAARTKAIDNHLPWLDAARFLGCHSIRVNAQSSGTWEEQRARAADGLHRLCVAGEQRGLSVIVENHGGLSSNGKWLAEVMKAADHPGCGTLPDFGNFKLGDGTEYDRYQGVAELMPFAKAVSAKSHDFGADGNETHTDYRRMMKIVLGAGYRGFVGVEFEGGGVPEEEGIRLTKALLERVREETTAAGG